MHMMYINGKYKRLIMNTDEVQNITHSNEKKRNKKDVESPKGKGPWFGKVAIALHVTAFVFFLLRNSLSDGFFYGINAATKLSISMYDLILFFVGLVLFVISKFRKEYQNIHMSTSKKMAIFFLYILWVEFYMVYSCLDIHGMSLF